MIQQPVLEYVPTSGKFDRDRYIFTPLFDNGAGSPSDLFVSDDAWDRLFGENGTYIPLDAPHETKANDILTWGIETSSKQFPPERMQLLENQSCDGTQVYFQSMNSSSINSMMTYATMKTPIVVFALEGYHKTSSRKRGRAAQETRQLVSRTVRR